MKVSTEIDNNFGYEKITQMVDNIPLRNRLNISQPSYRLSTYQQSYFPSTIKLWNTLDLNLRQLPTLPSFKFKLQQKYFQPKTVPSYFFLETDILVYCMLGLEINVAL